MTCDITYVDKIVGGIYMSVVYADGCELFTSKSRVGAKQALTNSKSRIKRMMKKGHLFLL